MSTNETGRLLQLGIFRGTTALELGVSRKHLATLIARGIVVRELPDTYRVAGVPCTKEHQLRAALLWAGSKSAAAGRSAGELYALEGVRSSIPEIVVPHALRPRSPHVVVHRVRDTQPLMIRVYRSMRVTGVEATLVALASILEKEALEIACEDARRRRLTSIPAIRAYLQRFGRSGVKGVGSLRALVDELDPRYASRSPLEVRTRRLLVANGFRDFVREFPLTWNGRTYRYDFGFPHQAAILETNGRRWHDDPNDYEHDNEKWSVPARHGYRIVFATWEKVTNQPGALIAELAATLGRHTHSVDIERP